MTRTLYKLVLTIFVFILTMSFLYGEKAVAASKEPVNYLEPGTYTVSETKFDRLYFKKKMRDFGWSGSWNFRAYKSSIEYLDNGNSAMSDVVANQAGYKKGIFNIYGGSIYSAARKYKVKNYVEKYEVRFNFIPNKSTGKDEYGFIEVRPMIGSKDRWEVYFYSVKTPKKTIEKEMYNYFKENSVEPYNKIAALDFYGGKLVDDKTNKLINKWFETKNWKLKNKDFFQTDGSQYTKDLSKIQKLASNSNAKGNLENTVYFEKYFPQKGDMKYGFFVDFCVSFRDINGTDEEIRIPEILHIEETANDVPPPPGSEEPVSEPIKNKSEIELIRPAYNGYGGWKKHYIWLVVKPAKMNAKGTLTRYYLDASVTLEQIYNEMEKISK